MMRNIVLAITFGLMTELQAQSPSTHADRSTVTRTLTIVGSDYAFLRPPDSLSAGQALFGFANRGSKRHELVLVLLRPGFSTAEAMRSAVGTEGSGREWSERIVGVLIAAPGDSTWGRISTSLLPNRSYLLICSFRDTVGALPHHRLGMIAGFRVTEP